MYLWICFQALLQESIRRKVYKIFANILGAMKCNDVDTREFLAALSFLPKIASHLCSICFYYMADLAELIQGEKEHSDWFPERSQFCYTDH